MELRLAGQTAIVTGASSGIGREAARQLATEGCTVVAAARRINLLDSLAEEAAAKSQRMVPLALDVSKKDSIKKFAQAFAHQFSSIDILVNNAGYIKPAPLFKTDDANWEQTLAVNLGGVQRLYAELFSLFQQGVRIVNVSSLAGFSGAEKFAGFGAYTAAKSGLGGLTQIMAVELKELDGRANALCPGAVDTPMLHEAAPGLKASMTAADVARHIVFLSSRASFPLNGQNIALTG